MGINSLSILHVYQDRDDFTPRKRSSESIQVGSRTLAAEPVRMTRNALGTGWESSPIVFLVDIREDAGGVYHVYAADLSNLEAVDRGRVVIDATSADLPERPSRQGFDRGR